jgi:TolB-like protein
MSFFAELKRRNVFRVGIAYIIAAWLLLQVADVVLNNIEAPGWVFSAIMLVLGLGFPIAVIFAWAFEVTPEGIKKEKEVDRSQSIVDRTGRKLDRVIIAVLVLALGYFAFDKFVLDPREDAELVAGAEQAEQEQPAAEVEDRKSIAVLPFASRSDQASDEYFTEGIHDDLLTHLAKIGSMKVISRTSVMRYKGTEKSIPEIAEELQVATVLEGGIQRSGSQVRINVQLIDAKTDEHLWAEIFDRELTAENLFAIQSEIATEIANALEATLSPEEQIRLADVPTTNMAASNASLRGRQLQAKRTSTELEQALAEFTRATELDPQYALAWVGVAEAASLLSSYGTLPLSESLEIQENAVNRALEINDELGEVYASQAGLFDFKELSQETDAAYRKAIELSPNYASAYHWYSNFLSRYIERLDEAAAMLQKAAELDPMSSIIQSGLANLLDTLGRYDEAEEQYLRVIELDPDFPPNYNSLAFFYGDSLGDYRKAIEYIRIAQQKDPGNIGLLLSEGIFRLNVADSSALHSLSERMQEIDSEHFTTAALDMLHSISLENYAGALEIGQSILPKIANAPGFLQFISIVHILNGDWVNAREVMLQALPGYQNSDGWQVLIKQDMEISCRMAEIYLRTGADSLGEQLIEDVIAYHGKVKSMVEDEDRIVPSECWLNRGDFDLAIDALESAVAHKHYSFWWLWIKLPAWDPVRADPRFQAAVQAIEAEVSAQRRLIAEMNLETDA